MIGDLGAPKMSAFGVRSPGHEGSGVIVKVGENVKGWKVGDRGGVKPLLDVCRACELCWGDKETYCNTAIWTGWMKTGERKPADIDEFRLLGRDFILTRGVQAHTSNTSRAPHVIRPESLTVWMTTWRRPSCVARRLCTVASRNRACGQDNGPYFPAAVVVWEFKGCSWLKRWVSESLLWTPVLKSATSV